MWFRGFINNLLKGADVRNAVGANGVVVSGTIASPYATIGFGAPVTLPGPVTISAPSGAVPALTVNGANGSVAAIFNSFSGANDTVALNTPSGRFTSLVFRNANAFKAQLFWDNTNSLIYLGTAGIGTSGIQITGAGAILGSGPVAGTGVDMTPDRGTFTMSHTGFTTAVTSNATWYRIGNAVLINTGTVSGTSNATTWTGTGAPAALQPNLPQTIIIGDAIDSGAGTAATMAISAGSSTFSFGKGFTANGAWTNAGAKGFGNTGGTTFSYLLN